MATTIEELEKILANPNSDLKVEITPSGEVRAFKKDEPREQGPVRILTFNEFQTVASNY